MGGWGVGLMTQGGVVSDMVRMGGGIDVDIALGAYQGLPDEVATARGIAKCVFVEGNRK